jgi:glycosyltransferase involved in cell wall biosynthesis
MRVLFVGVASSIHTARWISQISGLGWDLHLFDPENSLISPALQSVTLYTTWKKLDVPPSVTIRYRWPFLRGRMFLESKFPRIWRLIAPESSIQLAKLIQKLSPDCIHSLGMQIASYYVADALVRLQDITIPWIYSAWGSDYYYYAKFPEHRERIVQVLSRANYLTADCERDLRIAQEYGFRGKIVGVFPTGGGYPVRSMLALRGNVRISKRHIVALKGLQHYAGRALVALEALKACKELLANYEIVIYQAAPEVKQRAIDLEKSHGLTIRILSRVKHEEMWALFGRSRLAIGYSISDGTPNAMLEAMIMGALPVQSDPGGASAEWIEDGANGLLVSPDNLEHLVGCIRKALIDDELVDSAADLNRRLALEKLDKEVVQPKVIEIYRQVFNSKLF